MPPGDQPSTITNVTRTIGYPEPATEPAARATVPGYAILGEIGRGGMGVVYKAKQDGLNRLVALKMVLSGAHAGDAERQRFKTEVEAAAALQHPNIVQVYEVGEQDRHPYCALEYCPGGSIADRLVGGPLPPREAVRLVETVA